MEHLQHKGDDDYNDTDLHTLEVPEFDPRGYLKVPGIKAKLARAIKQCPSIWELGHRINTIVMKEQRNEQQRTGPTLS
jgi:hypothetical protein